MSGVEVRVADVKNGERFRFVEGGIAFRMVVNDIYGCRYRMDYNYERQPLRTYEGSLLNTVWLVDVPPCTDKIVDEDPSIDYYDNWDAAVLQFISDTCRDFVNADGEVLIWQAAQLAAVAHRDQKRKYTGESYFWHCHDVAKRVAAVPGATAEMIATAYLHDVIEDTSMTCARVERAVGNCVAGFVASLTDVYTKKDYPLLNRKERKLMEASRYRKAGAAIAVIKWCDLQSNTESIVKHDPKFAVTYLREKADTLESLLPRIQWWLKTHGKEGK